MSEQILNPRRGRLSQEYGALFNDAPPVLVLYHSGLSEEQCWDEVERAIQRKEPIVIEIPDGIEI